MRLLTLTLLLVATLALGETIPEKPTKYFNDNANLVSDATAHRLNETLAQFERDTSNQFVVVTYPYMDTESDAADYTQRISKSWGVGQKGKNNGLVLFVFMKTADGHGKIYAQVGYGLEGAIPDATAYQIIQKMIPAFKSKDYEAGLDTGIKDFMTAAKGEYTGNGKTVAETLHFPHGWIFWSFMILALVVLVGLIIYYSCFAEDEPYVEPASLGISRRSFIDNVSPAPPSRSYAGPYTPPPAYVDAGYVAPSYISPSDDSPSRSSDDDYSPSSSSSSSDSFFSGGGGGFGGGGAGGSF